MSPILDTDRLIRPTTAAAILGVTRDGVHKRIAAGTLQAIPIDGHLYLDREEVEAATGPVSGKPKKAAKSELTPTTRDAYHEWYAEQMRRAGFTQSVAEPWKWFAPLGSWDNPPKLPAYCPPPDDSTGPVSRPRGGGTRRKSTPATRGRVSESGTSRKRSRRGTGG